MKRIASALQIVAICLGWSGVAGLPGVLAEKAFAVEQKAYGLTIGGDGVLMKDQQPYRGIGVNYFSAFYRHLLDVNNTTYNAGFAVLAKENIPFVRMIGCGFYPSEQKLYEENPKEFFRRFDDVVQSAEKHRIGLIPSLFWNGYTVSDLVGEPVSQWGNMQSKTHQYMCKYVRDVVVRYRNSPAIWGWEFGNEWNLAADLPNASQHRPPMLPRRGTPTSRSKADEITYEIIRTAFAAFAKEVRRYDDHRVISSGNSAERSSAWHNWKEKNWKRDTPEQFSEMLQADNPNPINTISIHVYEGPRQIIDAAAVRRKAKKPLFVGEFGVQESSDAPEKFRRLLAAIEKEKVELAAVWVYDRNESGKNEKWNVTSTNERAYQLKEIAAANERIRKSLNPYKTKDQ
jgi:hypothetical protein